MYPGFRETSESPKLPHRPHKSSYTSLTVTKPTRIIFKVFVVYLSEYLGWTFSIHCVRPMPMNSFRIVIKFDDEFGHLVFSSSFEVWSLKFSGVDPPDTIFSTTLVLRNSVLLCRFRSLKYKYVSLVCTLQGQDIGIHFTDHLSGVV